MKKELKPGTLLYPVPVALVTCAGKKSGANIITIAWTGIICSDPPMVSISVRPHRHSSNIIKESGEFVINVPTEDMLEKTDRCGTTSGRYHDKFDEIGLTPMEASKVKAPLIEECPVNLECVVQEVKELGAHDVFLAEVVAAHADDEVLEDDEIQISKAMPLVFCPPTSEYWSLKEKIGEYAFTS